MNYHLKSREETFGELNCSSEGLSGKEAEARLEKNGKNKLAEAKKTSLLKRFISQLIDPMILILIGAAIVSAVTSFFSEGSEGLADVFIIMFVVILNAILGVVQESKAEKAIEALKEMTAATSKVIRDGELVSVKSEDLVIGDVIVLEAGDAVPADARIIECASLKVEEAALTGESVPVTKQEETIELGDKKEIPLGDRKNMLYMGSVVVYGRGKAVITATGMDTEMGKIADALVMAEDEKTPLQIKLAQLSKILTYLVLGICVFIFAFGLIKSGDFSGKQILDTFMVAVSLAVAAIPEGLAAVVTIVLSIGVTKMSKRNAVIRKLTAVETLGCTQIICSDKTGTLTQNKMTVVKSYGDNENFTAESFALCTDAKLPMGETESIGDPTQTAVVNFAAKLGLPKYELEAKYPRVGEIPFDSMRKLMTTVHNYGDKFVQHTTGAPDVVIGKCSTILRDGKEIPLTDEIRKELLAANTELADQALRVLAAGVRYYENAPTDYEPDNMEKDLCFLGLVGMIDPVRPEVKPAIEKCKAAGIRPIMITGDHIDTAFAIARELNIVNDKSEAITGSQLNEMSDEELLEKVGNYSVYARVQPEHKVRIVKAWKAKEKVTAMTGDGVNDAPSIKSADIGVGMGITGTDVTKNVADMILADDNFATIVAAVEEGRRVYDNIKKSIQFLLSSNLSEVVSIFTATILGFQILLPVHILWINLITDSLPALALGMEKSEADIMTRKPRAAHEGIFSGGVGFDIAYQGIMVSILTIAAYLIGHRIEAGVWEIAQSYDGMTMAFLTMSMAEIFHSFNMRSQRGSIFKIKKQNWYLFGAMLAALVLTTAVIYIPFLSDMFKFEHIDIFEYAIALLLAISVIPIVEIIKFIQRKLKKNK